MLSVFVIIIVVVVNLTEELILEDIRDAVELVVIVNCNEDVLAVVVNFCALR